MVNSHYVPRLILRNFSENERINYCDFNNKKIEIRNIKSVFSEKGYYPDEIEKDLCNKIEVKFANLLHNKILKERYKVVLNRDELFTLKKYLIITSIRYNISKSMKNSGAPENYVSGYSENFYSNINKVLACETLDQMYSYIDPLTALDRTIDDNYGEIKLFVTIKNIIHSYVAIVSTNRCKEDLIIPDVGFAYKATHLAMLSNGEFDKCTYTLNYAVQFKNPYLLYVSRLLTPYDYIFCPITKELGILSLSVFFKFFNNKSDIYGLLPVNNLRLSELLGFGSSDTVEPPKVDQQLGKAVSYEYGIKMLSKEDIHFLNAVMVNESERYFGYCDFNRIRPSIEYYNDRFRHENDRDLTFMIQ